MKQILYYIWLPFFLPHIVAYFFNIQGIVDETSHWGKVLRIRKEGVKLFCFLILHIREFRSYLYFRNKYLKLISGWYALGQLALYFDTPSSKVGQGLVMQHGHSSRINAESIGRNCQIWHNVTIGKDKPGGERPIIGNDVKIFTGAIVLGGITIGDNVSIGAGAVVVKNVPSNCVVVGNPARIVKRDGVKVDLKL